MKYILGKKLDMTQVWQGDKMVAVTRVQAGPCQVAQIKTDGNDGYVAVQLGFGNKKKKNINKPQIGHLKGLPDFRYLREFRAEPGELKRGQVIDVSTFTPGDKVFVTGTSKGKGFQGVVRRHGFKGTKKTHGNKDQLRMPGSIGATGPAHVFKGQRMPGRMGGGQITSGGLEIVEIDEANNILLIKGAVPGANNGLLLLKGEGNITVHIVESNDEKKEPEPEKKEKVAEVKVEDNKVEQKEEPKKEVDKK